MGQEVVPGADPHQGQGGLRPELELLHHAHPASAPEPGHALRQSVPENQVAEQEHQGQRHHQPHPGPEQITHKTSSASYTRGCLMVCSRTAKESLTTITSPRAKDSPFTFRATVSPAGLFNSIIIPSRRLRNSCTRI